MFITNCLIVLNLNYTKRKRYALKVPFQTMRLVELLFLEKTVLHPIRIMQKVGIECLQVQRTPDLMSFVIQLI